MLRSIHESLLGRVLMMVSTLVLIMMRVGLGYIWVGYLLSLIFLYWASYFWYKLSEYNKLRTNRAFGKSDEASQNLRSARQMSKAIKLAEKMYTRSSPYLSSLRIEIFYQYILGAFIILSGLEGVFLPGFVGAIGLMQIALGISVVIMGIISNIAYFGVRDLVDRIEVEKGVALSEEKCYSVSDPIEGSIEICLCDLALPLDECVACQSRLVDELP